MNLRMENGWRRTGSCAVDRGLPRCSSTVETENADGSQRGRESNRRCGSEGGLWTSVAERAAMLTHTVLMELLAESDALDEYDQAEE